MATATEPSPPTGFEETPYPISVETFSAMVDHGFIPGDRRVFLWGGRLYEKLAKSRAHAAVQNAFNQALSKRLPPGMFVGNENPVRLDTTHLPLPDLIVALGGPLDFFEARYPDARDVLLVVEVAVSSAAEDLGNRLDRYSRALPLASYIVADIPRRRILLHGTPRTEGGYETCIPIGPGDFLLIRLEELELTPIPFEELMP